ncbi:MAG TPA: outer membrane beta-barrel protein [Ignavibacteriales bacterium]|nr:outer membrane beta-barrel protein [Ignavibacteriales bacterium]
MVSRLSILFLFLFAAVSFAQNESNNPDSLLLECNFIKLQEVLKNVNASKAASYQGIISVVKEIPNLNNKEILIGQAKSNRNYYTEAYAGLLASKAFDKFESSANKGSQNEAITYFYIARYFKNNYISGIKTSLDRDFKEAQECFSRRDFKRSLDLCQYIETITNNNPFFTPVFKDSVKSFSLRAKEKFMIDEKEKKDWSLKEKNDYKFSVTMGGGLIYYPSFSQYNFPNQISAKLKKEMGFGYSFSAGYKLLDYLRLNFSYSTGGMKYKELDLTGTSSKASIEVKNSDFLLSARYYPKTTAGICPYIGLGYGYSSFTRSSFSCLTSILFKIDNWRIGQEIIELSMPENSFSATIMNAAFGLDYIPSAQSRIMYNLGFSFDKSSQADYFLKGNKLAVGFNVGILL